MNSQTILVTGGAGFIGSHLVDRLLQEVGVKVVALDSFSDFYDPTIKRANVHAHLANNNYQLVQADIRDRAQLQMVFDATPFDAIVHLAAGVGVRPSLEQPFDYEQVNITGTLNLLELARQFGIKRFIFGSSSSVYGNHPHAPFREEYLPQPISPYAATKAAGEMLAYTYSHLHQIQTVCLRFFTVYGPRQRPDLAIHKFARLMTSGQLIPVFGDGTTERDYTYVADIVGGILAALQYEQTPFEIINLGCSQTVPLHRVISLLEEALSVEANIERQPLHPGDLALTHADVSKAARLLRYEPTTTIETGIQKFVSWFKTTL
ncbi:MAG: GDP-mannose 4,6-dehydratase [Blastocatellia bacterium]